MPSQIMTISVVSLVGWCHMRVLIQSLTGTPDLPAIALMLHIPNYHLQSLYCIHIQAGHELHLFTIQGECISVYQSHYTLLILPTGSIPKSVRKKPQQLALDYLLHHGHYFCMALSPVGVFCVNTSLFCHSNNILSSLNVTL